MRRMLTAALTIAGTAGIGLTGAAPAQAAGCSGSGGAHTDNYGNTYGTTYCTAYTGGNVMNNGTVAGYLNSGRSWFVCQAQFTNKPNPAVGSARNNYWLYTQADTGSAPLYGWGWFPATKISGGGNYQPIPGLRQCDSLPVWTFPSP